MHFLCVLSTLMTATVVTINAQDISFYTDHLGYFKVFESGEINQVEHLPVSNIVVGGDYLFYQDDLENLIYYSNGEKERIQTKKPGIRTPTYT